MRSPIRRSLRLPERVDHLVERKDEMDVPGLAAQATGKPRGDLPAPGAPEIGLRVR